MTQVDVSIVVPTFRGASRLPVLFEAMRAQDFAGSWELIVVVDGVVDDSVEVAKAATDLPLRLVVLEENQGRSAALNAGFATAQGRLLVRCDDDLEVPSTFVSAHVAAHIGDEPVGAIGLCHDELDGSAYARVYGRPANSRLRDAAYGAPPATWWKYWAANCSIPRAIFDQVGPYDETFRVYGWEDVDWGYRLSRLGVPVVLEKNLEVIHHAASASCAIRVHRAYAGGRAHAHFDYKHGIDEQKIRPAGVVQYAWASGVWLCAQLKREERFVALAGRVDRILDRVPPKIGARMVALLVESGAIAGYRGFSRQGGIT